MKILILLLWLQTPQVRYYDGADTVNHSYKVDFQQYNIVERKEDATILLYDCNRKAHFFKDHCGGKLYEVDFKNMVVWSIKIPKFTVEE